MSGGTFGPYVPVRQRGTIASLEGLSKTIRASDLAALVDHTLLRPEATTADIVALCAEAAELGVAAICIAPSLLPLPGGALPGRIGVATVVGFPSGAHTSEIKAAEAAQGVAAGATEIDMVANLGWEKAGEWKRLAVEVRTVRESVGQATILKVIVESAILSDDELVSACSAVEDGGADFVKTSTGFHPAGGATVHAVGVIARAVGTRLGVKASGGIHTAAEATAMVRAGATRLGTSRTRDILAGLSAP